MPKERIATEELKKAYDNWHLKGRFKIDELINKEFSHWILNILNARQGAKILDVACGKGVFLYYARKKGLIAYGIDISKNAIEIARKINPNSEIVIGYAESLPYEDNIFDYVTCLGSLEHFPDYEKGVREISRVLKNEGRVCIYVPNLFFLGHIYMTWRYGVEPSEGGQQFSEIFKTRKGWEVMFEKNGLKVLKCYKYNKIWASNKVSYATKIFYNIVMRPFIPLNLSYSFAFICKKV